MCPLRGSHLLVRFSGGWTDYFHGFEYFGLITLVYREFWVLSMRFFWRACSVCAIYGFVSVAWRCVPTLWPNLTVCLSCGAFLSFLGVCGISVSFQPTFPFTVSSSSVCAACAVGSCAGSCSCLAQGCRGGAFFPKSAVFTLVFGEFSCLHLDSLAALVVLPFRSVCLYYA